MTNNKGIKVIMKRYNLKLQKNSFKKELKILAYLRTYSTLKYYPRLMSYKIDSDYGEILMSDVGKDLQSIIDKQLKGFASRKNDYF